MTGVIPSDVRGRLGSRPTRNYPAGVCRDGWQTRSLQTSHLTVIPAELSSSCLICTSGPARRRVPPADVWKE